MIRLADKTPAVDVTYCERLIAKAILFRTTEKIVTAQGISGLPRQHRHLHDRPKLAHDTGQRIDLDRIWREQKLDVSPCNGHRRSEPPRAYRHRQPRPHSPTSPSGPSTPNAGTGSSALSGTSQISCGAELIDPSAITARGRHAAETRSQADAQRIIVVASISAETWFVLARWAKETQSLEPWQRRRASEIGRCLSDGQGISVEQATDGERIMTEARRLGFRP